MTTWMRVLAFVGLALALMQGACRAAEIIVFSDGPLATALNQIAKEFPSASGHAVRMVYGTAPALRAKLTAGERPDVLISLAAEIDEMAKHNDFASLERIVAAIKLGLAVRSGVAIPDIKTLDGFKQTLIRADAILYNSLASGLLFARQLERIGIVDQVKSKVVVIKGNTQLNELAKRIDNGVAGGQLTQLMESKIVQFVGPLPQEAQAETVYSAGALASSKVPDAARTFVQFLTSPKAAAVFAASGAR